jgi:hypothetical protein
MNPYHWALVVLITLYHILAFANLTGKERAAWPGRITGISFVIFITLIVLSGN